MARALLIGLVLLAGCSAIERNPATAQLAVQYATLKVIERADAPFERRDRIVRLAEQALDLASGDEVLVSAIETAVREAIDWQSLAPSDQLLAEYLVTLVATELRARVGDGDWLRGENLVSARQVLGWVIEVARI